MQCRLCLWQVQSLCCLEAPDRFLGVSLLVLDFPKVKPRYAVTGVEFEGAAITGNCSVDIASVVMNSAPIAPRHRTASIELDTSVPAFTGFGKVIEFAMRNAFVIPGLCPAIVCP
jgi:hypothetical protein